MQDLIKHEQFELETLDRLNSKRLLNKLVFVGGTMLRLCFGLNRYSVDLDFWLREEQTGDAYFKTMLDYLSKNYTVKDAAIKHKTYLYEFRSPDYPRSLKIEIRKENRAVAIESSIAYSPNSNLQVLLNTISLKDMMAAKIAAFIDRKEARDCFDMEFMLRKGIPLEAPANDLKKVLAGIKELGPKDFSVKLGSLLAPKERAYYNKEKFKFLEAQINEVLNK